MKKLSIALGVILAVVMVINLLDAVFCHSTGNYLDFTTYGVIYTMLIAGYGVAVSGKKQEILEGLEEA